MQGVLEGFLALFVIMDPVGNIPIFLPLTRSMDERQRARTVLTAAAFAVFLLVLFLVGGNLIFEYLSFGLAHVMVAGGALLILLAFRMMFGEEDVGTEGGDIAIVPLGMPLMSGPGSIATIILFGSTYGTVSALTALALAMPAQIAVYLLSSRIMRVAGINGIRVMAKVSALVAASFGVSMVIRAVQMML